MNHNQRAALANPNLEFAASTFLGQPVGPNQMLFVLNKVENAIAPVKILFEAKGEAEYSRLDYGDTILVVLPPDTSNITFSPESFVGYNMLEKVIGIEDSTALSAGMFTECTSLVFERLNQTIIPEACFAVCTALTRVEIPNALTVEVNAFAGCTNLTVILNDDVQSVAVNSFANIDNLIYHGSLPGAPWGATKWNGVPQN